ncbi:MAG: sensor histidine kinase [Bacteroidia bacterium]
MTDAFKAFAKFGIRFKSLFKLSKYPKSVYNEIEKVNTQKIAYLSIPLALIHLHHIYTFRPQNELVSENIFLWKQGILYSHSIGLIATLVFGISAFVLIKKQNYNSIYAKTLHHSSILFYLIFAIVIVGIDQRISANNSPFLLVSIAIPAISLVWPLSSLIYNFIAYLFYYYTVGLLQNDQDLLLSLRVNGITFSTIGAMVNFLFWNRTSENIYQKELIQNQKVELEKANETKDKFFSIIAHDLKGPIGNINNGLEILDEDELDEDTKKELLKHVKNSAKSTYDLLDNLLNWALIQKGQLVLNPKNCKLNQIILECIQLLNGLAKEKKIEIHYLFSQEIEIFADESTIKTICRNLLSNAIKYSPINGVIKVTLEHKSNFSELIIEDSGIGIEQEKIQNLFIVGMNKSLPGTSGEKGTGLGLILCKEFTEKNNGYLTVSSELGKGSKFIVGLPNKLKI